MGIPLTLSQVPSETPYIQYVATNGQTVFPYPFAITQDSDLVVVVNGASLATDSGYTLSGQGNPTGGNVTFASGQSAGTIVTLYRDVPIERLTQFAQNGGFSSTAFNAEFNNVYLLLQQLQQNIDQCLQIPNTNNPAPVTTLAPTGYANKYLAFDANGNPEPAALTSSGSLTGSILSGLLNVFTSAAITPDRIRTPVEIEQGVMPTNYAYRFGDLRRYGATGGPFGSVPATDDSTAWANAVKCGYVIIPQGMAFKVVTGASYTGQITVIGSGPTSQLYCDGTILTVTSGTGSIVDNVALYNITAPWIITRNPANWAANIASTLQQSSTVLGYQPTVNDSDIWSSLTTQQQNQQIGPTITFTGISTDIKVSRITGRFAVITIMDSQFSQFRDCDIRGGKGSWGGLVFDNATNNLQPGLGNSAIGCSVRYASFSGITFLNNNRPVATGNVCQLNGESGIKAASGPNSTFCVYADITGNTVGDNYYDGIDCVTSFPTNTTTPCYHHIADNHCYRNGGDGINADGRYASVVDNYVVNNYRYGVWGAGAFMKISGNVAFQNNVSAGPNHDILGGNADGCIITDNYVVTTNSGGASAIAYTHSGYVANNYAQGGSFLWGAPPTSVLINNVDASTGGQCEQSFVLNITNNAGTLQHAILNQSGALTVSNLSVFRVNNVSGSYTNTPTGPDATTAFAAGGKIGSASTNDFWLDTNDQLGTNYSQLMATVIYNDTGTSVLVRPQIASLDINGVTIYRLVFNFMNGAAAFALTTTNIPAGKTIQVQFYGKLA